MSVNTACVLALYLSQILAFNRVFIDLPVTFARQCCRNLSIHVPHLLHPPVCHHLSMLLLTSARRRHLHPCEDTRKGEVPCAQILTSSFEQPFAIHQPTCPQDPLPLSRTVPLPRLPTTQLSSVLSMLEKLPRKHLLGLCQPILLPAVPFQQVTEVSSKYTGLACRIPPSARCTKEKHWLLPCWLALLVRL